MTTKQPKPFTIRERIALFLFLRGPSTRDEIWEGCGLRTFVTKETRWGDGEKPTTTRRVTKKDTNYLSYYDRRCTRRLLPRHTADLEKARAELGKELPEKKPATWSEEVWATYISNYREDAVKYLVQGWYGATGEKRRSPHTGRPLATFDLTEAGREHMRARLAEIAGWHATRRPSKPRPIA